MRAIAIESHGDGEQLRRRALPAPQPQGDELSIRIVAAGVSRLDATAIAGRLAPQIAGSLPWVPGFEGAGVVESLGPDSCGFRVGDRVWALLPGGGAYGQQAVVGERTVAALPAALLFEEAATLALDGLAGWSALFEGESPIDGSSSVTVLDAHGGAGHLVVQLALAVGARVFVAAPPGHRAFVEQLGSVEWIDRDAAREQAVATAAPNDRIVETAPNAGAPARGVADLGGGEHSVQAALALGKLPIPSFEGLTKLAEQRRLRPQLFQIMKIAQASDAQALLEGADCRGKIALTF